MSIRELFAYLHVADALTPEEMQRRYFELFKGNNES